MSKQIVSIVVLVLITFIAGRASAQSFRVQCPTTTITHTVAANNNSEPAYTAPSFGSRCPSRSNRRRARGSPALLADFGNRTDHAASSPSTL